MHVLGRPVHPAQVPTFPRGREQRLQSGGCRSTGAECRDAVGQASGRADAVAPLKAKTHDVNAFRVERVGSQVAGSREESGAANVDMQGRGR